MNINTNLFIALGLIGMATQATAGLISYGLCQTACNAGFVTCVVGITGMTMGPGAVGESINPSSAISQIRSKVYEAVKADEHSCRSGLFGHSRGMYGRMRSTPRCTCSVITSH